MIFSAQNLQLTDDEMEIVHAGKISAERANIENKEEILIVGKDMEDISVKEDNLGLKGDVDINESTSNKNDLTCNIETLDTIPKSIMLSEDDQELNTALVTGTDEWFDALDHTASEFISVTPVAT